MRVPECWSVDILFQLRFCSLGTKNWAISCKEVIQLELGWAKTRQHAVHLYYIKGGGMFSFVWSKPGLLDD